VPIAEPTAIGSGASVKGTGRRSWPWCPDIEEGVRSQRKPKLVRSLDDLTLTPGARGALTELCTEFSGMDVDEDGRRALSFDEE
jgi:hypothetical protein